MRAVCAAGSSRAITPGGLVLLSELALRESCEVWTGCKWASCRVAPASGKHRLYIVRLSCGRQLVCSGAHTWALLSDRAEAAERATTDLAVGDMVFPYNPPEGLLADETLDATTGWARAGGHAMGELYAGGKRRRSPGGISPKYLGASREAQAAFVLGWAEAQRGLLLGSPEVARDLRAILLNLGVAGTRQQPVTKCLSRVLHPEEDVAAMLQCARSTAQAQAQARASTIEDIQKDGQGVPYHVWVHEAGSVVLDGVLALAPPLVSADRSGGGEPEWLPVPQESPASSRQDSPSPPPFETCREEARSRAARPRVTIL
jgi:hypothetical protein